MFKLCYYYFYLQIQRIVDWLEHCAAESMENEFMKNAKHFSDQEVAWPNTLGQLLVSVQNPFFFYYQYCTSY